MTSTDSPSRAAQTPDPNADGVDPTLEADVFARGCNSRAALQNATGRWGALALAALNEGPYRFSALRRRVDGVSERMLSQTLQTLERDGLVHREVLETIPPKVEYSLTELGADVAAKITALIELLESQVPKIVASQASYDARNQLSLSES
ncbi:MULTISPECIES: helix-turn-helix domain-containing protein [Rhodococcus]|jgi:DNA-binding HxlR family transcriptional regulator|uniref:Winged helix-turn-helix transcriptional regulator n=1 Tax=Rhodococcus baikonurensis TaxID=172041 RepID=A0ABV5XPD8_9NOCA|nr:MULTISPECIES: helix-turn-helix domain-containing protein [Rhodococcus]MBJ7478113.1 helix-turn-helix transcriptional regulator [Rhodococcus sp. (in: high G+C Gram-positive bacteria)]MBT2264922.1 helix-turn-helix transcriptional regulator [Rhodococcus erythropolis]MDI9957576.1 helix-turn-helix domain-containing protein [Rhodococcus sp. IEGM 1237]MDI9963030.1 helix-turn-helix domain-containing protein [Rhodococcus sp. IEGM 1251]MDV8125073.1 helix-turn-helix domain-containing protein [Rhodococc